MTRRKPRSGTGTGLFAWTPDGDITPTELAANPLTVPCRWPNCRAPQWQRCVGLRGRPLTHSPFHPIRQEDADTAARTEPPTP